MNSKKIELLVGSFLLAGIAAILMLGLKVADSQMGGNSQSYELTAKFDNVGGLKVRSAIKVGGVVVGRVSSISLDSDFSPKVTMEIDSNFNQFPDSSSVAILTSGLLGEQFIGLTPGFVDEETEILTDGGVIEDTRSAMVLEDLIGQFLYGNSDD
ncbi:outer membrane lipid asymmetry maintenance protein MlaD [Psychrobium sp. 1_MG-2023]|uniref:outer membrane lipid asymmetry maintenance protein MlaD n=1 Tax=Psychrobium sp. 1_MG-2023 TaxID=3062624 RepID=UPI000C320149|nr:outer membrane lipid asymmetry maintenance protein MlaD [Psychrobium sp. 1_MG-2023]MDP2560696.1 outer membrane lipid asymmetry maintenance protein MlaD [Psychrobium sp. 1_MG-2023]PKF56591.1 outer membrane lipid asymmetry maintenance protein MlaD [Alteromonadales bacterium alter-6D02]